MQFSIACLISCSAELLLNRHTRKRAPLGLERFACDGSRHSFTTENRQSYRKPQGKPFCISQRENPQKLLFLLYRKLRCISYKAKKRSAWIALRRNGICRFATRRRRRILRSRILFLKYTEIMAQTMIAIAKGDCDEECGGGWGAITDIMDAPRHVTQVRISFKNLSCSHTFR